MPYLGVISLPLGPNPVATTKQYLGLKGGDVSAGEYRGPVWELRTYGAGPGTAASGPCPDSIQFPEQPLQLHLPKLLDTHTSTETHTSFVGALNKGKDYLRTQNNWVLGAPGNWGVRRKEE